MFIRWTTSVILGCICWWCVPVASQCARQAEGAEPIAIRFETLNQTTPLTLPAREVQGIVLVPLKAAVAYLGGQSTWQENTKKVVLKGNSGRQAVVSLNLNRIVIDRKQWVRLPHLPRMVRGQVLVSPESLVVIWKSIGNQSPEYNPNSQVFRVGTVPAAPVLAEETKPAAPVSAKASARKPLVVIDAGHGGKDPGAIGPTGLKEKTVVLEIAQQLKKILQEQGIKVIMTRDDDTFIPLPERAMIANRAKADLFVSIHANASRNRQAVGSQVFIYNREASSQNAAEAARFENQDANYLEIIKDDLRQSVHEESSITVGGLVSQQVEKLKLDVKRIERAPFYVLAKSHMPSVLVETAFISNHQEEQKLRSRVFCKKMAEGIELGIHRFYQEKKQIP